MAITQIVSRTFTDEENVFFTRMCRAISAIGTVSYKSREEHIIKGTISCLTTQVSVIVRWSSRESTSSSEAEFTFSSFDEFGSSIYNAAKRLLDTYLRMDQPGFEPDLIGVSPKAFAMQIMGGFFLLAVFILLVGLGIIH